MDERSRVETAIRDLIFEGLLRIRGAGWRGDAALCAIEADHIHNLSALLNPLLSTSGFKSLLQFYWEVERTAYLRQLRRHEAEKGIRVELAVLPGVWETIALYRQDRPGRDAIGE